MYKNKLGYLLIIIISGLFAILYNEYYTGIIFLVVLSLPIILFAIMLDINAKIKIHFEVNNPVAGKEEIIELKIILENTSIFPITRAKVKLDYYNNFAGDVKQKILFVLVDHRSTIHLTSEFNSKHCGILHFYIRNIQLFDYFNIFSIRKKINAKVEVAIIPEVFDFMNDIVIHNNNILIDSDTYSTTKSGDDPSEVFRIRDYREGDSFNRIHWKLSYKRQELMIKEFSDPLSNKIIILIDLNCGQDKKNSLDYVDGLLECALSLSFSLLCTDYEHVITWYDGNEKVCNSYQVKNEQDMNLTIKSILSSKLESSSILREHGLIAGRSQYTHMFLVTSQIYESEIFEWVNERKGTILYVFYVNDMRVNPLKPEIKYALTELQVIIYEIDVNNIAESIRAIA
jgi:uncharacterized protein (DUF58 family)